MRRFWLGLLVGLVVVWVIIRRRGGAWVLRGWRRREVREPVRIPLPEEPVEAPGPQPAAAEPSAGLSGAAMSDILAQVQAAIEREGALDAYCARCKTQRPIADPRPTVTSNNRAAVRGRCAECGTKVFRFVKVETLS